MALKEKLLQSYGVDLKQLCEMDPDGAVERSGMRYFFDGVNLNPLVVMRVDNSSEVESNGMKLKVLPLATMTRQLVLEGQTEQLLYSKVRIVFNKKTILSNGMSDS